MSGHRVVLQRMRILAYVQHDVKSIHYAVIIGRLNSGHESWYRDGQVIN